MCHHRAYVKRFGSGHDSDYTGSKREQLLKLAPQYGTKIVADEKFGAKDSDMTAQLTRIQRTDAEAFICWTVGPTEAIVTKNWKQLAMKIPLYHCHGAASKQFLQMTGKAGEGIIFQHRN